MVQEAVGGTREEDMTESRRYDLIVIGGGPAGQGAAELPHLPGDGHWSSSAKSPVAL